MTLVQSIREKYASMHAGLDSIDSWRESILSAILGIGSILGAVAAIPSVIAAAIVGMWQVVLIDVIALGWITTLWRMRTLSLQARTWNLGLLLYLLGTSFLFVIGLVSQIYLMAFPVIAALMLGLRPALLAIALNAVTLLLIGFIVNIDMHVAGLAAHPLFNWIVITLNFSFISLLITMSTLMLIKGLEKSLERARGSEAQYRNTFQNAPVGVSMLDLDGRRLQVNRKLCEITGYSTEDLLKLSDEAITYPEDFALDLPRCLQLLCSDVQNRSDEKRFVRRDGSLVWVQESVSLIVDSEGEMRNFISVVEDISPRKQAEEKLIENEERLRLALDAASQGWFDVDLATGRVTVSPEYPLMIGYTPEEFHSDLKSWITQVHPEDRDRLMTSVEGCIRDGGPHFMEYRRQTKAGSWKWIRSVGKIVEWDSEKRATRMIGIHTDIDELKKAELASKESELRYRILFEHSQDSLFLMLDGHFVDCNPASLKMFGCSADQIIGRSPASYSPELQPDGRPSMAIAEERIKAAMAGESQVFEWQQLRHDGSLFEVEVILNRVDLASGSHILASVRDITERKRTEEERRIAAIAFESQEGVFVTDPDTVILRVNHAFTSITGYTAEEAVGQTPHLFKSNVQDEVFYAELWSTLKEKGVWQGEIWNRRKNDEVFPEWLTISAVHDSNGKVTNYVATLIDITRRKESEKEIEHLAFYDLLTQLPNRRLLMDRLKHALAASARNGLEGALLFIDLDNFKMLNDTLGHDVGDQLLQLVAQRLLTCVREGDTVARIGGDEFVVMLEDLSDDVDEAANRAKLVGEKILGTLNQPYQLSGTEYHNTPSIGATLFTENKSSVDELLKRADLAMYQAKAAGRNALRFFDPEMQTTVSARVLLEAELRLALQMQQFIVLYQPQIDEHGNVTGAEALLRWQHPRLGLILPDQFIALAEETGQIIPLGLWVLEQVCSQLVRLAAKPAMSHLTLAVNVSARQFHNPGFVAQVLTMLDKSGANPQRLKIELTESLLLHDVEDVITKMTTLKERGVGFSLDDFGIGYSSLTYLKRLPLEQLKIDQSFVRDILVDSNDAAIAGVIVALAQSMNLQVMAEGVETVEQKTLLSNMGCRAYQGFLFGRPETIDALEHMCGIDA